MAQILVIGGERAARQAAACAKLGGRVVMLGAAPEEYKRVLSGLGVNVNHVNFGQGAASCTKEYIDENVRIIEDSNIVLMTCEMPEEVNWHAVNESYRLFKFIIVNPTPVPGTIPEDVLSKITWLVPNETELEAITGEPCGRVEQCVRVAKILVNKGANNVLVSCGAAGAVLAYPDGTSSYTAELIVPVDLECAGDTFCGAFAVYMSEGKNSNMAIEFAVEAATETVKRRGGIESIPTRNEVMFF